MLLVLHKLNPPRGNDSANVDLFGLLDRPAEADHYIGWFLNPRIERAPSAGSEVWTLVCQWLMMGLL